MDFDSNLLKKLVNTYSPSGSEEQIREIIKQEIISYVDDIKIDKLGNLIAIKKGTGKKIMIAAHMDQIGLMITDIDDDGFLRFTNIGGISPYLTLGQRVVFENGLIGVVFMEDIEDKGKLKLKNMYIDIGAENKDQAESMVNIGDSCVYYSQYYEDKNRIISRGLDDRIGCFVLIQVIKRIQSSPNDLYFTFTVQEELGIRGAKTSAYAINPDIGIAVDITASGDTPKAKRLAIGLHKGTAIKVKDNSLIAHPKVKQMMINVAQKHNIDYQMEVLEHGGTDSGAIHLSRSGVPSGVISIPTRYTHTANEIVSKKDVINSINLLSKLIENKIEI